MTAYEKAYSLTLENYKQLIPKYVKEFSIEGIDINTYFNKVESGIASEMTSEEVGRFCSEVAASMITINPGYNRLASIITIKQLHSITLNTFADKFLHIQVERDIFHDEIVELVLDHSEKYNSIVDYSRDYLFDYFGLLTLMKTYLLPLGGQIAERPQDVYMRCAIQLYRDDFDAIKQFYDLISHHYFTHATPTLYNSCYKKPQMASCFLLACKEDSSEGIFDSLREAAMIRKFNGGLGMHLSNIRCNKSPIRSTGGTAKGIIPVVKMITEAVKYFNKNETRRSSSCAFYLEPWHKDVFDFLDLRKNSGNEEMRARDSFIALWMNDLFMERVECDREWSLFDPNVAKGLADVHGEEFKQLYEHYENTVEKETIPAQTLWKAIIRAQIETGTPYVVYKDACNKSSNQSNLGTIKSSNLCAEVIQYSDKDNTAVCNLASLCLPKYVETVPGTESLFYNFRKLYEVTKLVVRNINKVIDGSFYPSKEAENSNIRMRPMGIGVQGLADVFFKMHLPFESDEAVSLNKKIFETMYFASLEASCELAAVEGPYPGFRRSMYSRGIFHHEIYGRERPELSGMWDWETLRKNMIKYKVRNSLTLSCMPTATTAQICGNSECIEPVTSNIFTRRTFAGEFQCVNKYLMEDLMKQGLWSNEMRQLIIDFEGSIQDIPVIPDHIKKQYKTIWEIKMKKVLEMSHDRQYFIDQSQSLNIFIRKPTYAILSSMYFYGWKLGLKTGMYYLRTCPIASAIKFTIDKEMVSRTLSSMQNAENAENENDQCEACTL